MSQTNPGAMKARYGKQKLDAKYKLMLAALVVALIAVALIAFPPFITVPTGHTGVVVTFGRVAEHTLDEGFHLKNPFQQIVMMDNRTQKQVVNTQAFSSDIQQVDVVCSVNYAIDRETSAQLYKNVGRTYYNTVMEPRILENIKAVFTRYSAETLMKVRDTLSTQVKELLEPEMKRYGIQIVAIAIENVDFTDAFTNAVEDKQVAEQTKLRVETEQAQQVSVERSAAERRVIAANADAQERAILAEADASVQKIKADAAAYAQKVNAEAESEANRKIAASLTQALIDYQKINRWNGQLPYISGEGSLPLIDFSDLK